MTLVELLLCIAIVGILTALATSVALGGKVRAKRVVCLNNSRQLAAADIFYSLDHGVFPDMSPFVPSSISGDRLRLMAEYLGVSVPAGPVSTWPRRRQQPKWMNCPMAVDSGIAEGLTVGGGVYTGYIYVGGLESASMITNGFARVLHAEQAADRLNTRRGVLWADILDEYLISDPRRFEFFHCRKRPLYPDFRFHGDELDGIHRAYSDGSVEWTSGGKLDLTGAASPDLRIRHLFGNYYF